MVELLLQALSKISICIIIIDQYQNIVFWNNATEKLTNLLQKNVINKSLVEICTVFSKPMYKSLFESVLFKGQSRFCSSAIHKAFIYPIGNIDISLIRQNMKVEQIKINDDCFALIQITDVTDQVSNESKMVSLIDELKKDYNEIKKEDAKNKQLAVYDKLTGLLNRNSLESGLINVINTKMEDTNIIAMLFLDLDGFKNVNDTYGHDIGDILLKEVSERFKINTRKKDIVARFGGDEFIIILTENSTSGQVSKVAEKLVRIISEPYLINKEIIKISVSIGISLYPNDSSTIDNLIKKADIAMYSAKDAGKNCFRFFINVNK